MTRDEQRRPNPGTDAALALGCTCPVIDNHYGRGYRGQPGVFAYNGDCKVHAFPTPTRALSTYVTNHEAEDGK